MKNISQLLTCILTLRLMRVTSTPLVTFVVQSHKFSRCRGRLPIDRAYLFYHGHLGRETKLLSTRFCLRVTNADP